MRLCICVYLVVGAQLFYLEQRGRAENSSNGGKKKEGTNERVRIKTVKILGLERKNKEKEKEKESK